MKKSIAVIAPGFDVSLILDVIRDRADGFNVQIDFTGLSIDAEGSEVGVALIEQFVAGLVQGISIQSEYQQNEFEKLNKDLEQRHGFIMHRENSDEN